MIYIETTAEEFLPFYATEFSAGADLKSMISCTILAGSRKLIPTGLKFSIPVGYEIQIRPRSGLALNHGITVLNTPGTIDSDYRGEIGIILFNTSRNAFILKKGDRVAQMIVNKIEQAEFALVKDLDDTARGEGGFSSTGI